MGEKLLYINYQAKQSLDNSDGNMKNNMKRVEYTTVRDRLVKPYLSISDGCCGKYCDMRYFNA